MEKWFDQVRGSVSSFFCRPVAGATVWWLRRRQAEDRDRPDDKETMGLDMYLTANLYVPGWDHNTPEERARFRGVIELCGLSESIDKGSPSLDVKATVGYWRKANQIHRWFVLHVQGGEDECREHYVEREKLEVLRNVCKLVLANKDKAPEILATQDGFFFGGTEYDEWYFKDLEHTVEVVDRALKLPKTVDLYYRSSW